MNFALDNKHYSLEKSFKKEIKYFNKKSWFIVGSKLDFKKTNDFKTVKILDTPIVIFLDKDSEIKAFINVCQHRGAIIKKDENGNGPLICPYHFWSYDSDGKIKNIPLKEKLFNQKELKNVISSKKLKQWKLDFCGNFIFIAHPNNKTTLKNYLGRDYLKIKDISLAVQGRSSIQSWEWNANWKICVENSLDEYHAKFAHPTTFSKLIKLEPVYNKSSNVYTMEMPIAETSIKKWSKFEKYFNKRQLKNNSYTHYHFFPMNSISSSYGVNFFIQTYMPITHNKTKVISELYLTKNIDKKLSKNVLDALINSFLEFNTVVFNEDRLLCESVQNGITSNQIKKSLITSYEKRISFFAKKLSKVYS